MRLILQAISISTLALTVALPTLYLFDAIDEAAMKWSMLLTTIIWFAVTPFWMGKESTPRPEKDYKHQEL